MPVLEMRNVVLAAAFHHVSFAAALVNIMAAGTEVTPPVSEVAEEEIISRNDGVRKDEQEG
jgi:hypothetical protein